MLELYIFMICVFFGYIIYISINYGIQPSISSSYLVLPKDSYLLNIVRICYSYLGAFLGLVLSNSTLFLLAGALLGFVSITFGFVNSEINKKIYKITSIFALIISQLALIIEFDMWYISLGSLLIAINLLLFKKIKNKLWWQEIIIFIGIFIALGIKLLENY